MKNNYSKLAAEEIISRTEKALNDKGYQTFVLNNHIEALEKIKSLIPDGASVMNGSSVTLEQIGYTDLLKSGNHKWIDIHTKITSENDQEKRAQLKKEAVNSDFYLGSVHALTEEGDFIVASNTGSQLPHIAFTSKNLIFIVSTKKIVTKVSEGMKRLEEYVFPIEDKHMHDLYNMSSNISKILIFKKEQEFLGRKIYFVLVKQDLGF